MGGVRIIANNRNVLTLPFKIEVMLLVSRQGKIRLTKFYEPIGKKEKQRLLREVSQLVISRPQKLCNFVEWKGRKVVYKRFVIFYPVLND